MQWKNRIVETVWRTAEQLLANPLNWRVHPAEQRSVMQALLREVGVVDRLLAYRSERAGGAEVLIDGHMRLALGGEWQVDILDVNDEEADKLIFFYDVTTGLAEVNTDSLKELHSMVVAGDAALVELMATVADDIGLEDDEEEEEKPQDKKQPESKSRQGDEELCADCGRRIVAVPEGSE